MSAPKVNVHTQKPPRQLATPTDLNASNVQEISNAVNGLIADTFALFIKNKNYHWHCNHFRDYHLLLDEQSDSVLGSVDPLAERVRRIGGTTIRSVSHIASLQSIKDDNDMYVKPEDMFQNLINDNMTLLKEQRKVHEICSSKGDVATTSLLEDFINETEKRIWFLHESEMGAKNME